MLNAKRYDKLQFDARSASLLSPDGTQRTLTPIEITDIAFSYDSMGYESVRATGTRTVVRFYPDQCGAYTLTANGTEHKIRVTQGKNRGYVTVSAHDPRFFAFSDGTAYVPLGINLAFPTAYTTDKGFRSLGMRQYEQWFRACSQNGCTMARVWLGHEYFCPDTKEVGVFDGVQLAKIDALIDLARRYGIRLKLVIEQFRYFDYERAADSDSYEDDVFRKFNKNLYQNGRRCESSTEWMTDPVWQDAWLQKLSVLADHISGDPTVFAIELWNEMNCMPREPRLEWNRRMLSATKKLFPRHLVTNSLGSLDSDHVQEIYRDFCWEHCDIKELHRYLDRGASHTVCHDNLIDLIRDGFERVSDPTKPTIVAESGAVNDGHSGPFPHYLRDNDGILFCDSVYPPLFLGAADCGHIWHWDTRYVESKNLYHLFRPLRRLFKNVAPDREQMRYEVVETDDVVLLLACGTTVTLGYLRNKHNCWQTTLRDQMPSAPITNTHIPLSISGTLTTVKIHPNAQDRLQYQNNTLSIQNLTFGALLRWDLC